MTYRIAEVNGGEFAEAESYEPILPALADRDESRQIIVRSLFLNSNNGENIQIWPFLTRQSLRTTSNCSEIG